MVWNWQLPQWPDFKYNVSLYVEKEKLFTLLCGQVFGIFSILSKDDLEMYRIEVLSIEGEASAKIEGEILNRESLQSSIRGHFGLNPLVKKQSEKEIAMAEALMDFYKTFKELLSHATLFRWHRYLFKDSRILSDVGSYRTHVEPMQIVSNKIGFERVYFEAPPSENVLKLMDRFVFWYNTYQGPVLVKAAIAHVYQSSTIFG
jgi:Fic family protein